MQTKSYLGPFITHNPGYSGSPWTILGSGSLVDGDDATGYVSDDLTGEATLEHTMDLDDGVIPQTAEVASVTVRYRLGDDALATAAALGVLPYVRYADGLPAFQELVAPAHAVAFNNFDVEFPRDPDGLPWSRASIFRKRQRLLRFGLRAARSEAPSARIKWAECLFRVSFDLAVPIVVTDLASLIGSETVVLNGRIDPNGANGSYPVSYYFEYGTTIDYGEQTAPVENVVGSGTLTVQVPVTGLSTATGYHFRLVAVTADGTYYGLDRYFTTGSATAGRWRLDEFKRVPTGEFTAGDRTRITSFGFDRPSGFTDDCPFLVYP